MRIEGGTHASNLTHPDEVNGPLLSSWNRSSAGAGAPGASGMMSSTAPCSLSRSSSPSPRRSSRPRHTSHAGSALALPAWSAGSPWSPGRSSSSTQSSTGSDSPARPPPRPGAGDRLIGRLLRRLRGRRSQIVARRRSWRARSRSRPLPGCCCWSSRRWGSASPRRSWRFVVDRGYSSGWLPTLPRPGLAVISGRPPPDHGSARPHPDRARGPHLGAPCRPAGADPPIITVVMAGFTHARVGAASPVALLAGLVRALISFLVFFAVLALLLVHSPTAGAFVIAAVAALASWLGLLRRAVVDARRAPGPRAARASAPSTDGSRRRHAPRGANRHP